MLARVISFLPSLSEKYFLQFEQYQYALQPFVVQVAAVAAVADSLCAQVTLIVTHLLVLEPISALCIGFFTSAYVVEVFDVCKHIS